MGMAKVNASESDDVLLVTLDLFTLLVVSVLLFVCRWSHLFNAVYH